MGTFIKYVGGRPNSKEVWDRKRYIFSKDNEFTCEVPQKLVEWLAGNAPGQYQVVPTKTIIKEVIREVERKPDLKCDKCDFIAKTEQGLLVHKSKHYKKGGK